MFSHFFILSDRGDTLISRDFRGDLVKGIPEIFFRKVRSFPNGETTPFFDVEGIHFIHLISNSLYFVLATRFDSPPMFAVELLHRIASLCKDFCGSINEEAVVTNFPLIYEVLDEFLDYGYPQLTSTADLKAFVFNQAQVSKHSSAEESIWNPSGANIFRNEKLTVPGSASNKSILDKKNSKKNEVFIDIIENLAVCFDENGDAVLNEVNGILQVKSFLAANPEICLSFKDDSPNSKSTPGNCFGIAMDSIKFHECVNVNQFDDTQMLIFTPPDGEFVAMRYTLTPDVLKLSPFSICCHAEERANGREVFLRLRVTCNIPPQSCANDVSIKLPLPSQTTSISCDTQNAGSSPEYKVKHKVILWMLGKVQGGMTAQADIKVKLSCPSTTTKAETGPLSMEFELPMFLSSKFQIKSLKVHERNSMYTPARWVRYITYSDSYVQRISFAT